MLYLDIAKASFWDARIFLLNEARTELLFWNHCFDQYNGQPAWPVSPLISVITYSDASSLAWGGYSVNLNGLCAKGNFSAEEMDTSSTWRELKTTRNVLHSYPDLIKGTTMKHRTDNLNVVSILLSGSKKPELQYVSTRSFQILH